MPNSPKPSASKRFRIKRLISLLLLLAFLMIAFQFLVSSILIVKPEQTISQWENQKQPIDVGQAQSIISRLSRAEKLGLLPFKLTDENKINELYSRLYLVLSEVEQPNANLQSAEHYALQLTLSSPSYYLGWTLLAQSKISRADYTWENQSALTNSLTLGPFERNNQIRIIPVLLKHWTALSPNNKALVFKMLKSALNGQHTSHLTVRKMHKYNNIEPFSHLLTNSRYSEKLKRILQE